MSTSHTSQIIKASLALFSMFFGAGNILFPVMIGDFAQDKVAVGALGFVIGGVLVAFLGLATMMLYRGEFRTFFWRLGRWPGTIVFTVLILLLGPFGSIPRLITVSYGTMEPYLFGMNLTLFSLVAGAITFFFVFRRQRVVGLIAYALTPILLVSLAIILWKGLTMAETLGPSTRTSGAVFREGLELGYSLLDLVAAFFYAGIALMALHDPEKTSRKALVHRGLWSSLIAIILLCTVYIGLAYVGAYHSAHIQQDGLPEHIVRNFSLSLIGPRGGMVASVAVGLACLTTAISNVFVCASFLQKDLFRERVRLAIPALITLGAAIAIASLGFSGIAFYIRPILNFLYPALIVLCLCNLAHRLWGLKVVKTPVLVTFLLTIAAYLL